MTSTFSQHLIFFALSLASCLHAHTFELDGATGNIYQVDLENRQFVLLKQTEFAPQSDVGQSRFTVHWTDETAIVQTEERADFMGIEVPVSATFQGLDAANVKAMRSGQLFEARVARIFIGENLPHEISDDSQRLTGTFTPEKATVSRGGTLLVNGREMRVTLRKRNSQVFVRQPVPAQKLAQGLWKTTIHGKTVDGKFVIDRMEITALPDPRESDDPKLPRVLVIGDSISMNYHDAAKAALAGVANYHRNEGNSMSSAHGAVNTELWLGDFQQPGGHWDVIQFNHGLHDLKQAYDAATDTFGEYAVPLEEYKKNLEKQIAILKKTGAQLIWCSTTPIPNSNKGPYARRKGANHEFNAAALEVMKKHPDIIINDLAGVVEKSTAFDHWRTTNDVHFYQKEEQKLLGDAVADAVRSALARRKTSSENASPPSISR